MLQNKLELTGPVAILLAGVFIAGAVVFVSRFPAATGASVHNPPDNLPKDVSVPAPNAQDHWYGSKAAPVVLVEYSDFECYYCAQAYSTFKRLVDESNGTTAWVVRHFPLESIHPNARPAAVASECIAAQTGDEGFWKFVHAVFGEGAPLNTLSYTQLATRLGAHEATFESCLASGSYEGLVDKHLGEAIASGGQGTPHTIVIGSGRQVPLSGALPYAQFKAVIQSLQSRQ